MRKIKYSNLADFMSGQFIGETSEYKLAAIVFFLIKQY